MIRMGLSLLVSLLLANFNPTRADIILEWSDNNVVSSGPIQVNLYMVETGTSYIQSFGVSGASFQVTRNGAGTLELPLSLAPAVFDISDVSGSDPTVTLNQTSFLGAGAGGLSPFLVGTFIINPNPASYGVGSLSISTINSGADFSVYTDANFNQLVLDPTIFTAPPVFQYTLTAVPEPSSFALGLGAIGVWVMGRRVARRIKGSKPVGR